MKNILKHNYFKKKKNIYIYIYIYIKKKQIPQVKVTTDR